MEVNEKKAKEATPRYINDIFHGRRLPAELARKIEEIIGSRISRWELLYPDKFGTSDGSLEDNQALTKKPTKTKEKGAAA